MLVAMLAPRGSCAKQFESDEYEQCEAESAAEKPDEEGPAEGCPPPRCQTRKAQPTAAMGRIGCDFGHTVLL